MRLYCLSGDPNYPCFVLAAKGCNIMLDCALNLQSLQHFIPQMLVQNQRFESIPSHRSPNGTVYDNIKELNNRFYLNSPLEFSVPQFNLINIEDIDAVLISNSNFMLALPYLTRLKGFRANIYCTEPLMHFGRMLMQELTHLVKNNQIVNDKNSEEKAHLHKFPLFHGLSHLSLDLNQQEKAIEQRDDSQESCSNPKLIKLDHSEPADQVASQTSQKSNYSIFSQLLNIQDAHFKPLNWKFLYSKKDVEDCVSRIKLIDFSEVIDIFGSVKVQAKSSGYSIGSCYWIIESDCDTICYLSKSSLLNSHSKLFDQYLKNQIIDCLILTGLNQTQLNEPEQMIQDFCKACVLTLKNQGNVLIPVQPSGKIYDLIEFLYGFLCDSSLGNTPIYFMSHVAEQSLAYSNIFAEWLCDSKQALVYAAECPFQHGELFKNGLLKTYPGITSKFNDEFMQPCILFASHPSLRFGEVCHFIELWKNSPNNSFIFTDSEFNYLDALAPFQPIYANYYYFPIDTSLTSGQIYKLLKEPKYFPQIIASNHYRYIPGECQPGLNDHVSKIDAFKFFGKVDLSFYHQNDVIKLALKRKYENCEIESDLAQILFPKKSMGDTVPFVTFNAQLMSKNNSHVLRAAPKTIPVNRRDRIKESNFKKYPYGKFNLDKFLNVLRQFGLSEAKLMDRDVAQDGLLTSLMEKDAANDNGLRYLVEIDASNKIDIDMGSNRINVLCENDDFRVKIKDALLRCLKTL
ncbi:integrator complex subunit 9 [Brachionus plicatilis]|uniref:Integrator complex subunit 9 n=1 Tax=Brachionus plicatilis TaxID=10195 RepID=A0A3M7SDQ3_BRAPC|nr:integrator complex subunit 9 [Brachionus plicatilis]